MCVLWVAEIKYVCIYVYVCRPTTLNELYSRSIMWCCALKQASVAYSARPIHCCSVTWRDVTLRRVGTIFVSGVGYKFVRTLYNLIVKVVCLKFWHKPHLWLGGYKSWTWGGFNVPPCPHSSDATGHSAEQWSPIGPQACICMCPTSMHMHVSHNYIDSSIYVNKTLTSVSYQINA